MLAPAMKQGTMSIDGAEEEGSEEGEGEGSGAVMGSSYGAVAGAAAVVQLAFFRYMALGGPMAP